MSAYYNEIDPLKAEIIRQAIMDGAIAPGDVDERSIADVEPADLVGYTQCHFFAGGGFWSLALRQAGWPDDREVWTGSCPCPSFSAAGKGQGFSDPRHLWPHWARLIRERHPPTIFGEQVSAAIGHGWLDLVQADLEAQDYAVGKIVLGACSVGAPHIRQRLYFVAQSGIKRGIRTNASFACCNKSSNRVFGRDGDAGIVEHAEGGGLGMRGGAPGNGGHAAQPSELGGVGDTGRTGLRDSQPEELRGSRRGQKGRAVAEPSQAACWLANASGGQLSLTVGRPDQRDGLGPDGAHDSGVPGRPGPLNGFWRDADWIGCRDGKFRPVEPGTFPLASGYPGRVGLLRLAGDAICVPAAQAFIESYLEIGVRA